jgi:hypothetical protein
MRNKTSGISSELALQFDAFTKELGELGVSYVGHGLVSTQGDHTGYFSHKKWGEIYLERKFFHDEPILDRFLKTPFEVVHWNCVEKNKVPSTRHEITNVVNGVTLCNFHSSFFGFLNLGFSDDRCTTDFVEHYKPLLSAYHQNYDRRHMVWRSLGS